MAKEKLQLRKQELVRDTIYDAAIDLFAAKGFDETTVEEIAQAAGVSRRSFFRYYASKDDLLAQSVVQYGSAITKAVETCPASLSLLETLRETVLAGINHTASVQELTRRTIQIAQRSTSARKAHASRLIDIQDAVATAYARRFKSKSIYDSSPRLMAQMSISILNVAITSWFTGEYQDLSTSAKHVLASLDRIVCATANSIQPGSGTKARRKPVGPAVSPKSRK